MEQLLSGSLPFVLPVMAPILALLLAPLLQRRGRTIVASLLGTTTLGLLVDILVFDHSHDLTLAVPSVFGRGAESALHVWTVDTVTAPAWLWHVVVAIYVGIPALLVFALRNRAPAAPRPVPLAVLLFVYALAARLALEKSAAHVDIVWALGTSAACFCIAPFFGYYCGRRGFGFGRLFMALVIANAIQRVLLVTASFFATTRRLGTHLDVHLITDVSPPGVGEIALDSPSQAWLYCIVMPQLTFALIATAVVGLVLGLVPWWFGKRRAAKS